MKICTNCILPETFPGVKIDEEGVCSHCRNFAGKEERLREGKEKYAARFLEMIEGHPPFPKRSATAVLAAHLTQAPPRVSTNSRGAKGLDPVIQRAMAKDPVVKAVANP